MLERSRSAWQAIQSPRSSLRLRCRSRACWESRGIRFKARLCPWRRVLGTERRSGGAVGGPRLGAGRGGGGRRRGGGHGRTPGGGGGGPPGGGGPRRAGGRGGAA